MIRAALLLVAFAALGCGSSSSSGPTVADAAADTSTNFDTSMDSAAETSDSGADASTNVDASEGGVQALTCAFVNDAHNCWREIVQAIDLCIPNGDTHPTGVFSADHSTCTYVLGRVVTFAAPIDPSKPSSDSADRDFTITSHAGATCVHYVEHAGATVSFTVTGPDGGVFDMKTTGNDMTITCPDGTTYEGDTAEVTKFCGIPAINGGLPAHQVFEPGTGEARFELNGESDYAYDCVSEGAADAGTD